MILAPPHRRPKRAFSTSRFTAVLDDELLVAAVIGALAKTQVAFAAIQHVHLPKPLRHFSKRLFNGPALRTVERAAHAKKALAMEVSR